MTQRPSPRRGPHLVGAALLLVLTACGTANGQNNTSTPGADSPSPTAPPGPPPNVMVVVLENQEYSDVIGSSAAPYINKLADQFGLATAYHARTHPSLPNYIDLIAGSQMDIHSDCTDCNVDGDTLVDQLAKKHITWTAYMGGMPSVCYDGAYYPDASTTGYAKKHNPFVYFDHLRTDPTACQNDVPDTQLAPDLQSGKASQFLWVSPSLCDDGHNTSSECGLGGSDRWLSNNLPMIMASSWYTSGGIVIVTWDEGTSNETCCNGAHGGHIATLVISKSVKPGARLDKPVDHAGTLRTIEALYGLSYLNEAADPHSGDLMPLLGRHAT
jgi:hypothetical protein